MSDFFYEWRDAPDFTEDQSARIIWSAGWSGYLPQDPAKLRMVVEELNDPDSADHFTINTANVRYAYQSIETGSSADGSDWPSYPFVFTGTEVQYLGNKIADVQLSPGKVVFDFAPVSFLHDYGTLAGYLLLDVEYMNSTELAGGEHIAQRLQLTFLENGSVISQNAQDVLVTGVDDVPSPPPVPPQGPSILGTVRPDVLQGTALGETIDGDNADDQLFGNGGNDVLLGGNGDDILVGGHGSDVMTGGRGNDVFVFGATSLPGDVDRITDFKPGVDHIRLVEGVTITAMEAKDLGPVPDGVQDTLLTLSNGGVVQVVGVTLTGTSFLG